MVVVVSGVMVSIPNNQFLEVLHTVALANTRVAPLEVLHMVALAVMLWVATLEVDLVADLLLDLPMADLANLVGLDNILRKASRLTTLVANLTSVGSSFSANKDCHRK